jgi:hypothetical protein
MKRLWFEKEEKEKRRENLCDFLSCNGNIIKEKNVCDIIKRDVLQESWLWKEKLTVPKKSSENEDFYSQLKENTRKFITPEN